MKKVTITKPAREEISFRSVLLKILANEMISDTLMDLSSYSSLILGSKLLCSMSARKLAIRVAAMITRKHPDIRG